jgi:hypothetical protein
MKIESSSLLCLFLSLTTLLCRRYQGYTLAIHFEQRSDGLVYLFSTAHSDILLLYLSYELPNS